MNRQIVLVAPPKGKLGPEHFRMVEGVLPEPKVTRPLCRTTSGVIRNATIWFTLPITLM